MPTNITKGMEMNYEHMSDLEINQAVTGLMFDCAEWPLTQCGKYFYHCGVDGGAYFYREVVDYCNNPSDAWPIIVENNISMRPMYIRDADGRKLVEWEAIHVERDFPRESFGWDDKNPLRAAMIVSIMMQEKK